jgi:tetratricopeptide (TPR) repeat protein
VAVLERARALDPLLAATSMNLGRAHLTAGRPQKAIPLLQTAITLNPDLALAHEQLGHALLARGLQSEAVAAFRQAVAVSGARESAHLAYALAAVGERHEAQAVLDELLGSEERQYLPPVGIALAHLGLGDPDAAFRWLERAYAEHAAFMDGVPTMPAFAPLHADPRWGHLMERMKWEPPGG